MISLVVTCCFTRLYRPIYRCLEVLPAHIAQGLHQVASEPELHAFLWDGVAQVVELACQLFDVLGLHSVSPGCVALAITSLKALPGFWASAMRHRRCSGLHHFPIQKLEKISPSKSSLLNSPVIEHRSRCARRSSSAN